MMHKQNASAIDRQLQRRGEVSFLSVGKYIQEKTG